MPRLEIPGGATGLLPPKYATVPGLRKGNASRCNIKRDSLMGAPSQPLRGGARVEGGREGPGPPSYAPESEQETSSFTALRVLRWHFLRKN